MFFWSRFNQFSVNSRAINFYFNFMYVVWPLNIFPFFQPNSRRAQFWKIFIMTFLNKNRISNRMIWLLFNFVQFFWIVTSSNLWKEVHEFSPNLSTLRRVSTKILIIGFLFKLYQKYEKILTIKTLHFSTISREKFLIFAPRDFGLR